jgi:hypothetical protein
MRFAAASRASRVRPLATQDKNAAIHISTDIPVAKAYQQHM